MAVTDERQYFLVRHHFEALKFLEGFIWYTDRLTPPKGFRQVRQGDLWIAFAYTSNQAREKSLRLVTGVYECTKEMEYRRIPRTNRQLEKYYEGRKLQTHCWMIEGRRSGPKLPNPVGVRSIDDILGRDTYKQTTLLKLRDKKEFDKIVHEARTQSVDHDIPVLKRAPVTEQELLCIVAHSHKKLGIDEIVKVRKSFPDILVRMGSREVYLELELNSKNFLLHRHHEQVSRKRKDGVPVAVLCWLDNDSDQRVRKYVHEVFELQSILRQNQRIEW